MKRLIKELKLFLKLECQEKKFPKKNTQKYVEILNKMLKFKNIFSNLVFYFATLKLNT